MTRLWVLCLLLLVILLAGGCASGGTPAGTVPPATEGPGSDSGVVSEEKDSEGADDGIETRAVDKGSDADESTREVGEPSPPAATAPAVSDRASDADVTVEGWVAGDYFENDRIAGKWVRIESTHAGQVDFPSLPDYDCWGGCYVPILARTCPLPAIDTLQVVRVSGKNADDGFGVDICVPAGGMVATGRTADGDPLDLVHFLAEFEGMDLFNRESTILASVVDVFSGSPDYFADIVRIRDLPSSSWSPTGVSSEEGMTLEVFAWFDEPAVTGRPFAVFRAAFIIWDR